MIINKAWNHHEVANKGYPRLIYTNRMWAVEANIAQQRGTPYRLPEACEAEERATDAIRTAGREVARVYKMRRVA